MTNFTFQLKCHRYFPKNQETLVVGDDIEVKCSVELHFGTYCVRSLQVRMVNEFMFTVRSLYRLNRFIVLLILKILQDNFQTNINHMQFLEWPDFGVPQNTDSMLQFCSQMRDRIEMEEGVIVVHCRYSL